MTEEKLNKIIHDLQQIKTAQRASQKREQKNLEELKMLVRNTGGSNGVS